MPKLEISKIEHTDDDRVYICVNEIFDVKIVKTDEGIVVDIYPWGSTGDPIATTYAYDNEALEEMEEV